MRVSVGNSQLSTMAPVVTKAAEDPRLKRLSTLCLALPEAVRSLRGDHADFRVRKKVFAYFLTTITVMESSRSAAKQTSAKTSTARAVIPSASTCRPTSVTVAGSACASIAAP